MKKSSSISSRTVWVVFTGESHRPNRPVQVPCTSRNYAADALATLPSHETLDVIGVLNAYGSWID